MKSPICVLFLLFLSAFAIAQNKQADCDFEGFKGKVKTVLTERADAVLKKGKIVETKRRKNEYIAFDTAGMRTAFKLYHWESGDLFDSVSYKLIDGDRASVYENITTGKLTNVVVEVPDKKPTKTRDPRYDYKLKYKYDDHGRIIEEAWWQNDGTLWLRYVYSFAENVKHESVFDAKGDLNQKYAYLLGPMGDVIEHATFDSDHSEKLIGRERYEYISFDPQGNWTKRVEYESEDGSDNFKVREVKYQTLTYY